MASSRGRSKKQSAGSRERPLLLPEDFVLYLDENLHNCKPILEALGQRGVKHERHTQHFQPGTEDAEWLPFVGQRGWILLTKDKRIRFNQLEKAAIRRFHVREFYFSSGNFTGAEMAEILVAALPEMAKVCRKHEPPFIASVSKSGKVSLRFE
jgi:PIN like domain